MGDPVIVLIIVIGAALFFWLRLQAPKVRETRLERERRAAAAQAERETEEARLVAERDALLRTIRSSAPDFILRAKLDFEREYRAQGASDNFFGHEMSPLVCFGYRVGVTNGRPEAERHAILDYAIAADLDAALPFLPADYRAVWGAPLSITRFNRIHQHLSKMADLRDGRQNFGAAVSDWRDDAAWFYSQKSALVQRYHSLRRR